VARLHSRIYLHFLGVLLVVGVVTAGAFAWGARGAFMHEVAERGVRHTASLAGEALAAEAQGRAGELERRLAQLHADLEIDVTVRAPDGRVLASAGAPMPPPSRHDVMRLRHGDVAIHPRHGWMAAAPIRDASGAVVAVLQTGAPRLPHWSGMGRRILGVAVALAVVALATLPLARRIARPVARLTAAARRLGEGDLSARVPTGRGRHGWRRRRELDELEELTRAFNDMAERVERLVHGQRALLANVSHELRSPLARLRVALELLPHDETSTARIQGLEADLEELERLIADVLTGSRLEATGIGARRDQVDAAALLADLAAQAARDPVTSGVAVTAEPTALTVSADAALLRRALWNLVENAAKYGAAPIALSARRDGTRVVFRVSDAGPGIPAEERERVLEPFYRRDAARTPAAAGEPPRGFGLGLTLARQIATAHGGGLSIGPASTDASGAERGCAIELWLPAT
jgi:two-component system OmpR family sensor kinase